MAEIKLLNVQVLGPHTFLVSQSQINLFIPCNSCPKHSLKCLTLWFPSTTLVLFLHSLCTDLIFMAGWEYDSHVLG